MAKQSNSGKRQSRERASARGREAPPRRSLSWFYIALGLIAVLGVAVVIFSVLRGGASLPEVEAVTPRPINVPTGTTPEGFAFKGREDAPVTVEEYADFQCPFCGTFATTIEPALDQQYIESGEVRWIFRDFPLQQHANALPAAEAARCAGDQGKFWPMHDLLFARQDEWAGLSDFDARALQYAQALGLDVEAFGQCLSSDVHLEPLRQAQAAAVERQIPGTPTFFVNGQQVDAQQLPQAIDAALAGGGRP
jgi:protein-disulfide isomerase